MRIGRLAPSLWHGRVSPKANGQRLAIMWYLRHLLSRGLVEPYHPQARPWCFVQLACASDSNMSMASESKMDHDGVCTWANDVSSLPRLHPSRRTHLILHRMNHCKDLLSFDRTGAAPKQRYIGLNKTVGFCALCRPKELLSMEKSLWCLLERAEWTKILTTNNAFIGKTEFAVFYFTG